MNIVISTRERSLDSYLNPIFEKSPFFIIIDLEKNTLRILENSSKNHAIKEEDSLWKKIVNEGIKVIITSEIKKRTIDIFEQYGIKIYRAECKIFNAIREFQKDKLTKIIKTTMARNAN
jgi:predicted Fe-Mo cluster-binding NifX family protein